MMMGKRRKRPLAEALLPYRAHKAPKQLRLPRDEPKAKTAA